MKRRFVLTPKAKADLREILLDVAEDNPDAAERLRHGFYQAFDRLSRAPGIGHYHDELLDRRYRFWNFHSYVVCYVWQHRPIQIIAVVYGLPAISQHSSRYDCVQMTSKPSKAFASFFTMAYSLSSRITRTTHPTPKSSIRSSGVPHRRQITAWQSPQTSGSDTGCAQVGQ